MSIFRITGTFKMGSRPNQNFVKEIIADTEEQAKELTYTRIGSKHGTKRNRIHFVSIEEILPEEVTDIVVKHMVGAKKDGTQ